MHGAHGGLRLRADRADGAEIVRALKGARRAVHHLFVEVLGQTALFTNGRVTQKELPDGLYKYDLREGESIAFATVEPSVAVNHAGTIITKEPIIFGEEGYIEFDDNSSPNFLGDEMSIEEFLNTDFDQDEDESQTMGGMQL